MTNAILVCYRIYFVFVTLIIGLAFGMNLLMSWFIEWLQDIINLREAYEREGRAYEFARLVIFFAVVSRCYLLIRLFSCLMCSAAHFLADMVGPADFQLYRCCLTGKAALVMDQARVPDSAQARGEDDKFGEDYAPADGQATTASMTRIDLQVHARAEKHLKMEPLWRLDFQMTWNTPWRWWLDLALQAVIHLSLDVGPLAIVLWQALVRQRPAGVIMRLFSLYACWATTSHIVIFHLAWTLNDYVAKWWAFRRLWTAARERQRAWGMFGVGGQDDPRQVSVTLVGATGLRSADSDGHSDPYCICRIKGTSGYEFQTRAEPMVLNPEWDHCQSMPVSVRGSTLEFEVWDHDILTSDDILGKATLKLSSAECDLHESVTTDLELGGHPEAQGSLRVRLRGLRVDEESVVQLASPQRSQAGSDGGASARQGGPRTSGERSDRLLEVELQVLHQDSAPDETNGSVVGDSCPSASRGTLSQRGGLRTMARRVMQRRTRRENSVVLLEEPASLCRLTCAVVSMGGGTIIFLSPLAAVACIVASWGNRWAIGFAVLTLLVAVWQFHWKGVMPSATAKVTRQALRWKRRLPSGTCLAGRRFLRNWGPLLQEWGEIHCGLAEAALSKGYELSAFSVAVQLAFFWHLNWATGKVLCIFALFWLVLRRFTIGVVDEMHLGWLVGLLEGSLFVFVATALNLHAFGWLTPDGSTAFGWSTLLLSALVQFTFTRYQSSQWRVYVASSLLLQCFLFFIIGVCVKTVESGFLDVESGLLDEPATLDNSTMPSARHAGPLAQLRALHAAGLSGRSAEEGQIDDLLPPPLASTSLDSGITSNHQTEANSERANYDFCTMKFGLMRKEEDSYLTILDFAHMAALANYEPNEFPHRLREYFPGWKVGKMCKRCLRKISNDWTTFYEIWSPQNRTTVFLTRGTQDQVDLLQDINLWLSTGIAQLFAWFGPDVSILASDAAVILSNGMGTNWFTKDFFGGFLGYVRKAINDDPERKYYFTGHSLGGGLAALVALEMSRVAVTFSSPGLKQVSKIVMSNHRFAQNADKLVYSIVPDKDLVPKVDAPLGSSLRIGCVEKQFFFCHRLQAAIKQLKCGGCDEHIAKLPWHFDRKRDCPAVS